MYIQPTLADSIGDGHMGAWGWTWGIVMMTLVAGLIVWLIVAGLRQDRPRVDHDRAMRLLDERYARGDIDRQGYLERKADLEV